MEEYLGDIVAGLSEKPEHVIIHHLPVREGDPYWTLQRLSICEVPYRVYGRQQLMADMQELGYVAVMEWNYPRFIEIPFKRDETSIKGYLGFYFRLKS